MGTKISLDSRTVNCNSNNNSISPTTSSSDSGSEYTSLSDVISSSANSNKPNINRISQLNEFIPSHSFNSVPNSEPILEMVETPNAIEQPKEESEETTSSSSMIYSTIRIAVILLIGFGAPLRDCLQTSDQFREHLKKYEKIYFWYRKYCRIITHLSLVINILIISLALTTTSETFEDKWRQIFLLGVSLLAVIAVDLMFGYKDSKRDLIHKLWANQKPEFESEFDPTYGICHMILIKLYLKFVNKIRRLNASLKLLIIVMLFNPLLAHLMMAYSILKKFSNGNFDKLGISFGIFNAYIIFSAMLYYIIICMALNNKIIALNNWVKLQTEDNNLSNETLEEIIKRFVLFF
jgi:hypothetical protein